MNNKKRKMTSLLHTETSGIDKMRALAKEKEEKKSETTSSEVEIKKNEENKQPKEGNGGVKNSEPTEVDNSKNKQNVKDVKSEEKGSSAKTTKDPKTDKKTTSKKTTGTGSKSKNKKTANKKTKTNNKRNVVPKTRIPAQQTPQFTKAHFSENDSVEKGSIGRPVEFDDPRYKSLEAMRISAEVKIRTKNLIEQKFDDVTFNQLVNILLDYYISKELSVEERLFAEKQLENDLEEIKHTKKYQEYFKD